MGLTPINNGLRRISSRKTFFHKNVFPFILFGITLLVTTALLFVVGKGGPKAPPVFILFAPLIVMTLGYFLVRKLTSDLMDKVYDAGDYLIVNYKGEEDRIMLANITNISHTQMTNPVRVTLMLRVPCRFGKKIVFCPIVQSADWKSFGLNNAIADELIERVDKTRRV